MNSNGSSFALWVHISLYRSLCVLMDSSGSLRVVIGPCSSIWNLMGPYVPLGVLIRCYGSL